MFRFGVSQFTSTPWGFERDVEEYSRLGVEAIEVCEDKLDEERFSERLALVGEQELEISSAQPSVRTLFPSRTQPEPKEPGERVATFRRTVERFGDFADGVPFVLNTGPRAMATSARSSRRPSGRGAPSPSTRMSAAPAWHSSP